LRSLQRRKIVILPFLVPVILLTSFTLYLISNSSTEGQLVIQAIAPDPFSNDACRCTYLNVTALVDGASVITTASLSLQQGYHYVIFQPVRWYITPEPRSIFIEAKTVTYATGLYKPIPRIIAVSVKSFNSTAVTALHMVTPVTWINVTNKTVVIIGDDFQEHILLPGESFTWYYTRQGIYRFSIFNSTAYGYVQVY
jgi:hypothetical protein